MKFQRDPILTIGVVASNQTMFRAWRSEFAYPGPSMRFMWVNPKSLNMKVRYDALIVLPCCYEAFNPVELQEAVDAIRQNRFRASLLEFERIDVPFGGRLPEDDPAYLARTDDPETRAAFMAEREARLAARDFKPEDAPKTNPDIRPEDAADPAGDPPAGGRP